MFQLKYLKYTIKVQQGTDDQQITIVEDDKTAKEISETTRPM